MLLVFWKRAKVKHIPERATDTADVNTAIHLANRSGFLGERAVQNQYKEVPIQACGIHIWRLAEFA
jgi:hypothetical protein